MLYLNSDNISRVWHGVHSADGRTLQLEPGETVELEPGIVDPFLIPAESSPGWYEGANRSTTLPTLSIKRDEEHAELAEIKQEEAEIESEFGNDRGETP